MRQVKWMTSDNSCLEDWKHHKYYESLIEDITGVTFDRSLEPEFVKYIYKRLSDTPYSHRFRSKHTVYQDEYRILIEKFRVHAENNHWIGVEYEKEKVC